jgi:hypothetical protein
VPDGNGRELLVVGNAGSFGVTEHTHRQDQRAPGIPARLLRPYVQELSRPSEWQPIAEVA